MYVWPSCQFNDLLRDTVTNLGKTAYQYGAQELNMYLKVAIFTLLTTFFLGSPGSCKNEQSAIFDRLDFDSKQPNPNSKIVLSQVEPPHPAINANSYYAQSAPVGNSVYSELVALEKSLCLLERPTDRKHEIVAVVFKQIKGPALLNSELKSTHFKIEYRMPSISRLTKEECNNLWGPTRASKADSVTYQLVQQIPTTDFFLDVIFKDDKIDAYRVRSKALKNPDWVKVLEERSEET